MIIVCPYCNQQAKLVDSSVIYNGRSFGMIWLCKPCDAYVGTHRNSKEHVPLGRLANKELRMWKMKAHAVFDPLWRSGKMTRDAAYSMLRNVMGMTESQAHIGKFDVEDCKRLVEVLKK